MFRRRRMIRWQRIGIWLAVMAAIDAFGRAARSRGDRGGSSTSGGGISIGGLGSSGNRINLDARSERLAELIVANEIAEPLSDAALTTIWDAVLEQANAGDAEAAAAAFEVARRQRTEARED